METLLSALVGEIASRSISFLIKNCSKLKEPTLEESLQSMQRLLLRVRVVIEEAEGRRITNQAMLEQLKVLRDGMYKGYYMLDTFKCQSHEEDKPKDHEVSHPFALCKFNPAKRICFSSDGTKQSTKEVQEMLDSLNIIIGDMNEFVVFLNSYAPMYRHPYSMYLFLDKCMFGRQMEMERIISFLLQAEPHGTENLGVLPVIGPRRVGKSTLVEHVCNDERVRNHFSQIVFLTENDLENQNLTTLRDGVLKHQNSALDEKERLLVVIELAGDVDDNAWKRMRSTGRCIARGSKIIVTSRSDKIKSFGTTQPLSLKFLPLEAYWYFFKVLTFGSTDPDEQPKLASIAMEICKELKGSFLWANIISGLLRSNMNSQFWFMVLACCKECTQRSTSLFSAHPAELSPSDKPMYVPRIGKDGEFCVVYNRYQEGFGQDKVPKITYQEVISGSAELHGRFEVLAWRSHVPPYYSYMLSCEICKPQRMVVRKKRSQKRRI